MNYRRHRQGQVLPCLPLRALVIILWTAHAARADGASKTRTRHPCQRPARAEASAEAPGLQRGAHWAGRRTPFYFILFYF
jgi:hypothetical protein